VKRISLQDHSWIGKDCVSKSALHGCPCGYFADATRECRCTPAIIQRYLATVSGPLLDRIDQVRGFSLHPILPVHSLSVTPSPTIFPQSFQ
jgi:hypothetical protein